MSVLLAVLVAAVLGIMLLLLRRYAHALADALDNALRMRLEDERHIAGLETQHETDLAILNGLGEGVLVVDKERHVISANRRFREMFDLHDGVEGKLLGDVIRVTAVFEGFDRALTGEESVQRFGVRFGLAERRIEMRALPLTSREAAVALFIDVSMIERLEQLRRNFVSDFSHEVRTPLAGLHSAVETFERPGLTAEDQTQLRRIMARQLSRLERLVDDLSELSRIESGELTLNRRPLDLRPLVDEVCEDFAEAAAQHGVRFVVHGGPSVVVADPLRVQQALSNLVDNAIKYGGDDKEIRIEIGEGAVRVTDQGEGIPPSERENIFRRLYRLDRGRSQEVAGTGLGLAIAKHLVLQQHGSIRVESEVGKGSTFILELPKH